MSTLQTALDDYLALRRALGFELRSQGRHLQRFVAFAQAANAAYITTELALQWATQSTNAQPAQWANRLGMVRRFAQYCSSIDPRTMVPPPDLLPYRLARPSPYIYRDEQIAQLIQAARALPPRAGLRPVAARIISPAWFRAKSLELTHVVADWATGWRSVGRWSNPS